MFHLNTNCNWSHCCSTIFYKHWANNIIKCIWIETYEVLKVALCHFCWVPNSCTATGGHSKYCRTPKCCVGAGVAQWLKPLCLTIWRWAGWWFESWVPHSKIRSLPPSRFSLPQSVSCSLKWEADHSLLAHCPQTHNYGTFSYKSLLMKPQVLPFLVWQMWVRSIVTICCSAEPADLKWHQVALHPCKEDTTEDLLSCQLILSLNGPLYEIRS